MLGTKKEIQIHIFVDNKMIKKTIQSHAPNVGDEIRLSEDKTVHVSRVVWCYDEPDCPFSRVNIEVTPVE